MRKSVGVLYVGLGVVCGLGSESAERCVRNNLKHPKQLKSALLARWFGRRVQCGHAGTPQGSWASRLRCFTGAESGLWTWLSERSDDNSCACWQQKAP